LSADNEKLKSALARMLPEEIYYSDSFSGVDAWCWRRCTFPNPVRSNEWLHVCWLIEQDLKKNRTLLYLDYVNLLQQSMNSAFDEYESTSASWQQRAPVLAKVMGIEIV
jgi:hypothetical protein